MKTLKLLAACILLALSNFVHAQWVSIPDNNFANHLNNNGFSQCMQGNNSVGWQLDTTCSAVRSAYGIQCSNKGIADLTGIQYFDSLRNLTCAQNDLTFLPPLPYFLRQLDCSYNQLTYLPDMPIGLQHLYANNNLLTTLPAGVSYTLYTLNISNNQFTSSPQFPASLGVLRCTNNQLGVIAELPPNLTQFECSFCGLDSIGDFPPTLESLELSYNYLPKLPALPASLLWLNCSANQIDTLPTLPNTLTDLFCGGQHFAGLPATLPDSLKSFSCTESPLITTIPALPKVMLYFSIWKCNVTQLPELPDYLSEMDISYNPIYCLPELKEIGSINFDSTFITCLPNMPTGTTFSTPSLTTIPICNLFNTNGCPVFANIAGKAYTDANNNCIANNAETDVTNIPVQLWQNGALLQQVSSAVSGNYSFKTPAFGTYQVTVDTTNLPFSIACVTNGSYTSFITALDSTDFNLNFALKCKTGFDLKAQSISTNQVFRPANFTTMEVAAGDASNFYNGHCAAGVSGAVTLSFTGPVKFISAAPNALAPNVTGNTLTYNIADFGTVNFFEDFDVVVQTDTTAQAGQQICFTLNVTPTAGDNNPANNTFSICYTVVNSFDPNDKQVSPSGNIDTTQRELVYTIRFQNTGNAEAQHIYITDTLSSHINPASFQLLAYSHAPMVQLDGNKLRFNFPNINLPDSTTNEPASHGYVQFKVKLNNGLPVGTVINNTAYIYFDFNAPVVTNTTTNTIYVPAPPAIKPVSIGKYRIDRGVKPNGRL